MLPGHRLDQLRRLAVIHRLVGGQHDEGEHWPVGHLVALLGNGTNSTCLPFWKTSSTTSRTFSSILVGAMLARRSANSLFRLGDRLNRNLFRSPVR